MFIIFLLNLRLGSCCSHAAAILFKVELHVRMGRSEKAAVTSGACMWKDFSRKEVRPSSLREISFHKAKRLGRQLQHLLERIVSHPEACNSLQSLDKFPFHHLS